MLNRFVRDKSLAMKLALAGSIIVALSCVVNSFTISSFSKVRDDLTETSEIVTGTRLLAEAQNTMWQLRYGISQYIAVPKPEDRQKIVADSPKVTAAMDDLLKRYSQLSLNAEQKTALSELQSIYRDYSRDRPQWLELMQQGKTEEATEFRSKTILTSGAGSVKAMSRLIELQESRATAASKRGEEESRQAEWAGILGLAAIVVGTGLLLTLAALSVSRPINAMTRVMSELANGNLTVTIPGAERGDEVGAMAKAVDVFRRNAEEARRLAAAQEQAQRER